MHVDNQEVRIGDSVEFTCHKGNVRTGLVVPAPKVQQHIPNLFLEVEGGLVKAFPISKITNLRITAIAEDADATQILIPA